MEATDGDGSVDNVQLFIDDVFVHEEGSAPWEWGTAHPGRGDSLLENLKAGTYTLRAEATDNDGATAMVSKTLTVESGAVGARRSVVDRTPVPIGRQEGETLLFDLTGQRLPATGFGLGTTSDRALNAGFSGMVIRRVTREDAPVKRDMIIR